MARKSAAEIQAEMNALARESWVNHMCLSLALTTKPDHIERFRETHGPARYVVSAYGLTRGDGGYVVTRFVHPGQRDSIRAYTVDGFRATFADLHDASTQPFRIAAERIAATQYRLLNPRTEAK